MEMIMTFMKLIYYEMKKLFSFTFIRLIVALTLVLNIAMAIFYIYPLNKFNCEEEMKTLYEMSQTDPDLFRAKYDAVIEQWYSGEGGGYSMDYTNGKMHDRTLFFTVECFVNADADYQKQMKEFVAKTDAMAQMLPPDSYNYRYQQAVIEKYEALSETVEIKNEPVYGWIQYFGYSAEVLLVLIAVFACAVVVGMGDTTTGFLPIRASSPRGGKSTIAAKFVTVVTVCFILSIVFALSSLITVGSIYGLSDPSNAIQSVFSDVNLGTLEREGRRVDQLFFCPLPLSIAEFLAVFFLQKAMASVMCGIVIFTVAILGKRYWLSGAVGGIFLFLQYRMNELSLFTMGQWKFLSVFSVFSAETFLSRLRCVDLFGYPVDLIHVFCALFLLTVLLTFLACMLLGQPRKQRRRSAIKAKG